MPFKKNYSRRQIGNLISPYLVGLQFGLIHKGTLANSKIQGLIKDDNGKKMYFGVSWT